MATNPSLSWQRLQDVYYSIDTIYGHLQWPVKNLYKDHRVIISANATLVAIASSEVAHPSVIEVYSASGTKLWAMTYPAQASDHIVDFAFHGESLIVLFTGTEYRIYLGFDGGYNLHNYTEQIQKLDGPRAEAATITNLETDQVEVPYLVIEAQCMDNVLVLRHKDKLTITNLHTMRNYETAIPQGQIHSFTVQSVSSLTVAILVSKDDTVVSVVVDFEEESVDLADRMLTTGPFSLMACSPNSNLVTLFNPETSKIFVTDKDFNLNLLEYDTSNDSGQPFMMEWSGNDAIALSLKDEVKLIGPAQRSISFFYDVVDLEEVDFAELLDDSGVQTIPILKTTVDGLKVFTSRRVEFLRRVPDPLVNLHLLGLSNSSSLLLDCLDKLNHHASKADVTVSFLKSNGQLREALEGCLDATLHELLPDWQKKTLRAVSFGKVYDDDHYDATRFREVLQTVKVLNHLRTNEIAIYLTYEELRTLGWGSVIQMLLRRSQYLVALTIVDLMQFEDLKSSIYIHWCLAKIRGEKSMSDLELFKIIRRKLAEYKDPNVKFLVTEICEAAHEEGRLDLYKLVSLIEPSTIVKVRNLLKINDPKLALSQSFYSLDLDLSRLLLLHLEQAIPKADFYAILDHNERPQPFLDSSIDKDEDVQHYTRLEFFVDGDLMSKFWIKNVASKESAQEFQLHAFADRVSVRDKIAALKSQPENVIDYEREYQAEKKKLAALKLRPKYNRILGQEQELLKLKLALSETYEQSFFSQNSLREILVKLLGMNQFKKSTEICRKFKLPIEMLWQLTLECYCKAGSFERLHKIISATSNPPIPFEEVCSTCIQYMAPRDYTTSYIKKVSDPAKRAEFYIKNEDFDVAALDVAISETPGLLIAVFHAAKAKSADTAGIEAQMQKLGVRA